MSENTSVSKIKKMLTKPLSDEWKKNIICAIMVTISTIIYCMGVMWFLQPASLYSGGVTGIAQLISNSCSRFFNIKIDLGLIVFLINIPILIFGWKKVSKRFVICSVISIVLQTVLMNEIIPVVDFGINTGLNPITGVMFPGSGSEMDLLLLSFVGGFISGVGSSLALRYGTSTGGVDILAQAVSFKKNISIGFISLVVNVIIAILGAFLFGNPAVAFYTIIRIIVQSVITDKVHTAYNFLKVEIVTTKTQEVSQLLLSDIGRGITIINAIGAYTHTEKSVLEIIISSYEMHRVIDDAKRVDPSVFITVSPVRRVIGNFKRKTIA
jgi:uncharacterized membrane-anchored protein YitT (DUF2179 family)